MVGWLQERVAEDTGDFKSNDEDTYQSEDFVFGCTKLSSRDEAGYWGGSIAGCFANPLFESSALKSITLDDFEFFDDLTFSILLRGLLRNNSVKTLNLWCKKMGPETMFVLNEFLSSPACNVVNLGFSWGNPNSLHRMNDPTNPTDTFLETVFSSGQNIKVLSLGAGIFVESANLVLRNIWRCVSLRTLNLCVDFIDDLDALTSNLESVQVGTHDGPRRISCLCELNLGEDGRADDITFRKGFVASLSRLLDAFPNLGCIGFNVLAYSEEHDIASDNLQYNVHRLDMNRSGGLLLMRASEDAQGPPRAPLSFWPLILERTSTDIWLQDSKARQANVIFHLLHGPAFVGRGALS